MTLHFPSSLSCPTPLGPLLPAKLCSRPCAHLYSVSATTGDSIHFPLELEEREMGKQHPQAWVSRAALTSGQGHLLGKMPDSKGLMSLMAGAVHSSGTRWCGGLPLPSKLLSPGWEGDKGGAQPGNPETTPMTLLTPACPTPTVPRVPRDTARQTHGSSGCRSCDFGPSLAALYTRIKVPTSFLQLEGTQRRGCWAPVLLPRLTQIPSGQLQGRNSEVEVCAGPLGGCAWPLGHQWPLPLLLSGL